MHKYPKLPLLAACFVLVYILFMRDAFDWLGHSLNGHGYLSMFLGGLLCFIFNTLGVFLVLLFARATEANLF